MSQSYTATHIFISSVWADFSSSVILNETRIVKYEVQKDGMTEEK